MTSQRNREDSRRLALARRIGGALLGACCGIGLALLLYLRLVPDWTPRLVLAILGGSAAVGGAVGYWLPEAVDDLGEDFLAGLWGWRWWR